MPLIKNAFWNELALEIPKKTLRLGPRETVEITDQEFESEGCQKCFREDRIIVIPEAKEERKARKK